MQKEKLKQNANPVGADDPVRPNSRGITLIALIITIIVMLILVGVSVTVALNGGLFSTAQSAKAQTQEERDKEQNLAEGKVEVNEQWYNSINEYVNGSSEGAKVTILPKKETYTVGDEVTIGNEAFFVITDDGEKVTLLAKYNLNTEGTAQLNATYSETACAFSSKNYWKDTEDKYPIDLNDLESYPIPEGETSIITKAKVYGVKIGGEDAIGRLMTKDEAEELVTEYSGIIYGTSIDATDGYLRYWLGSAKGTGHLWEIRGYDPFMGSSVSAINYDLSGNLRSTPSYRNFKI